MTHPLPIYSIADTAGMADVPDCAHRPFWGKAGWIRRRSHSDKGGDPIYIIEDMDTVWTSLYYSLWRSVWK